MSDDDRYRRFNLRIPKEAFASLQDAADARSHSMNAEIVQRLEASLNKGSLLTDALEGYERQLMPSTPDERGIIKIPRAMPDIEKVILLGVPTGIAGARDINV